MASPIRSQGNALVVDYLHKRASAHKILCVAAWCAYDPEYLAGLRTRVHCLDEDTKRANAKQLAKKDPPAVRMEVVRAFASRMHDIYADLEPAADFCLDALDLNTVDELSRYDTKRDAQLRMAVVQCAYSEHYAYQTITIHMCRSIMRAARAMCIPVPGAGINERYERLMASVDAKFDLSSLIPPSQYQQHPTAIYSSSYATTATAIASSSLVPYADDDMDDEAAYAAEMFGNIMDPVTKDIMQHVQLSEDESLAMDLLRDMDVLINECMRRLGVTSIAKMFEVTSSIMAMRRHMQDAEDEVMYMPS